MNDSPHDLILDTVADGLRRIKHTRRLEVHLATKRLGAIALPGDKGLRRTRKRLAILTYGRQAVEMARGVK